MPISAGDAQTTRELLLIGVSIPPSLPTSAARSILSQTTLSACASCRRRNDGGQCPLTGKRTCAHCCAPVRLRAAATFAALPASAARALPQLTGHPGWTTRAAAMSEADRRRETRAPPGADSADALSERFGLDRRLFNVPGGILAVGYCPRTLEERYDLASTRRWAEDRHGPDPEAAAQRKCEDRARRKELLLWRRDEQRRAALQAPASPAAAFTAHDAFYGEHGPIRKYQKTFNPLIRFAPFERLVKEIADDEKKRRVEAGFTAEDLRWSKDAILAMREAAEMHAINVLGERICSPFTGIASRFSPRWGPAPPAAAARADARRRRARQDIQLRRRIREEESG
eukprot:tig00020539_g10412.t1